MSFTFRPLAPESDAALLHSWVTQPYATFWDMQDFSREQVAAAYTQIQSSGHHHAVWGLEDGKPVFLMEEYAPGLSNLATAYAIQPGDVGMHMMVAPPGGAPRQGFTAAVMEAVLNRLFKDPRVERIVVEPDAQNTRIHALNARLGFVPAGKVDLGSKEALLSFCTRADFHEARLKLHQSADVAPTLTVSR